MTVERSVLRVKGLTGECVGVAFPVNSDGLFLTCAHVVDEAGSSEGELIELEDRHSTEPVEIKAIVQTDCWSPHSDNDVALLQVVASDLPKLSQMVVLPLRQSSLMTGRKIETWGFPLRDVPGGSSGHGTIRATSHDGRKPVLEIGEAPAITHLYSGAPLVDIELQLTVGMIQKGAEDRSTAYAIPADLLLEHCACLRETESPPYVGLRSFGSQDARLFFGRRQELAALESLLKGPSRVFFVIGPRGSGKTSLVQCGLSSLLKKLGPEVRLEVVRPEPDGRILTAARERHTITIVDQFEWTLAAALKLKEASPENPLETFFELVRSYESVASDEGSRIGFVLPNDFQHHLDALCPGEVMRAGEMNAIVRVNPLIPTKALEEMIREPLRTLQRPPRVDEALVSLILRDSVATRTKRKVKNAPEGGLTSSSLPLFQLTLHHLWGWRDGTSSMTVGAYQAMGGVGGVLARWADETVGSSAIDQEVAKLVLFALVEQTPVRDDIQYTRRRVRREDVIAAFEQHPSVARILSHLERARLVISPGESGSTFIELAHDALLTDWERMLTWLSDDRVFSKWYRRIRTLIDAHREGNRTILDGVDLDEAEEWMRRRPFQLNAEEMRFVKTARAVAEARQALGTQLQTELMMGPKDASSNETEPSEQRQTLQPPVVSKFTSPQPLLTEPTTPPAVTPRPVTPEPEPESDLTVSVFFPKWVKRLFSSPLAIGVVLVSLVGFVMFENSAAIAELLQNTKTGNFNPRPPTSKEDEVLTVSVRVGNAICGGFVIEAADPKVVTVPSCVRDDPSQVAVHLSDGRAFRVRSIDLSARIAVLHVDWRQAERSLHVFEFSDQIPVPGDQVTALGELTYEPLREVGMVRGERGWNLIVIPQAPKAPATEGGPIVDSNGKVVCVQARFKDGVLECVLIQDLWGEAALLKVEVSGGPEDKSACTGTLRRQGVGRDRPLPPTQWNETIVVPVGEYAVDVKCPGYSMLKDAGGSVAKGKDNNFKTRLSHN